MGQGTRLMRKSKAHRRLVYLRLIHRQRIVKNKEPCKVLLVCLNAFCYDFKTVDFSCEFRCNRSDSHSTLLYNIRSTLCRVTIFYKTHPWLVIEIRTCLVYSHIV